MLRIVLVSFLSIFSLVSCGPAFVPQSETIVDQWEVRRSAQNPNEPYLYTKTPNARVNRITLRLLKAAQVRGMHLVLADTPDWNAYMESIQKILIVTQGLVSQTPSDAELAAVIAHEIGHYVYHHSQATLQSNHDQIALLNDIASGADTREEAIERAQLAADLSNALIYRPESRVMEYEADSFCVFLMKRAGYDPGAAVNIWWKKHLEMKELGEQFDPLSTHPTSDERILNIMRTIAVLSNE